MKKGLLATTALVGAAALMAGTAGAAEAPKWKLSGNMNFQLYWVDQDYAGFDSDSGDDWTQVTGYTVASDGSHKQDHSWYFGVDEAELALNVSGAADNGLKYGFKIEIQVNTSDGTVADEARIQLSGSWGTLQLGDEDGAEDTMNYGGENLMGATGGFDGDFDDVLIRHRDINTGITTGYAAVSYPTIAGDTSDQTKVTYYSPRFSGFQVGASITPTPNSGDSFKSDGGWENHIGLGANYDNTFGSLRIQASAVYSAASSNNTDIEDISAYSVGGIVGFGPFSIGANYTDNGDSGQWTDSGGTEGTSYWNAAVGFETGPIYLSAGYFQSLHEEDGYETTFSNIALTADYTMAPGLGVYAEIDMIEDDRDEADVGFSNDATIFILGANVSF